MSFEDGLHSAHYRHCTAVSMAFVAVGMAFKGNWTKVRISGGHDNSGNKLMAVSMTINVYDWSE